MVWRASAGGTPWAASADGTASTTPALRRFMLSPMKALGLARNSATSIWSSETPGRWVRPAIFDSVSPDCTRYSSTPAPAVRALGGLVGGRGAEAARALGGAGARLRAGVAGRALLARRGFALLARRGAAGVGGSGVAAGGAAEMTGAVVVPLDAWVGRRALRCRRIEQQGVLADQAAGGPGDLEDDVDEGLLDAAVADEADVEAAVGAASAASPGWSGSTGL